MKCSKCGAELTDDAKFCSYCGNKIGSSAPSDIEEETLFPGVEEADIDEPDDSISVDGQGEAATPNPTISDKIKSKGAEKWNSLSAYTKITVTVIIVLLLLSLVAFLLGKASAGIIALLQVALMVAAALMKKQIIKTPNRWSYVIALALAAVLFIPYISVLSTDYGDAKRFTWSDIMLSDVVPAPKSHLGEIIDNSDDSLTVYMYKTKATDYSKYVETCMEKGFTVESEQTDISYSAYDTAGYKLSLDYDETNNKLRIEAEAPEQYGTLTWPDSLIASMLPVPTSTTGEIIQDDEKGFHALVSDTPIESFKDYVTKCADMGFSDDVSESDKVYSAKNSDGYQLTVSYQGNSVISVSVDEPEYEVSIEVECVENWLFSTYDVDVYVDGLPQGTIDHGATKTFTTWLPKGIYELKFVNEDDDEVTGTATIDIHQDEDLKYKISCTSTEIVVEVIVGTIAEHGEDEAPVPQSASSYRHDNFEEVQKELSDAGFTNISFEILYDIVIGWTDEGEIDSISIDGKTDFEKGDIFKKDVPIVITYHMMEEDDPNKPVETPAPEVENKVEDNIEDKEEEVEGPVYYSSNTRDEAKNGNSGQFAYVDRGKNYWTYYIIDFDEGYVYRFMEGNGEESCDRVKIVSGDLNSGLKITYHDGGDEWSETLHFKYENRPDRLIMVDHNHYEWEYYAEGLDDALKIKNKKTIIDR